MNKTKVKKYLYNFLIYSSLFLFLFSLFLLTMAYNVSSVKSALISNSKINYVSIEKLKEANPDFFKLAAMEIKIPDLPIPAAHGGTFEAYINTLQKSGKDIKHYIFKELGPNKEITDEIYVNAFFNVNAIFNQEITASYERPFTKNNSETFNVPDNENDKRTLSKLWKNSIINNSFIIKIANYSIAKKDYQTALKADIASLRYTRAFWSLNAISLENLINCEFYPEFLSSEKLYIKTDEYFHNDELKRSFKDALQKRVEFIKTQPDFTLALKNTITLIKGKEETLSMKDKLILRSLNLWYGDPNEAFFKTADEIFSNKDSGYSEFKKIISDAFFKNIADESFTHKLAYMNNDVSSILDFIKFAINTHPLKNKTYNYSLLNLDYFIDLNMRLRMITLAGFMRLFYSQNNKWPELSKDSDFVKQADICAIDPYTNKLFEIIKGTDENSLTITSQAEDISDRSKTIKFKVEKPY